MWTKFLCVVRKADLVQMWLIDRMSGDTLIAGDSYYLSDNISSIPTLRKYCQDQLRGEGSFLSVKQFVSNLVDWI